MVVNHAEVLHDICIYCIASRNRIWEVGYWFQKEIKLSANYKIRWLSWTWNYCSFFWAWVSISLVLLVVRGGAQSWSGCDYNDSAISARWCRGLSRGTMVQTSTPRLSVARGGNDQNTKYMRLSGAQFAHPEWGFDTQLTYCVSLPSRIDAVSLADQHKSMGESIVLRIVYLDMFMDGPILQSVLDDIEGMNDYLVLPRRWKRMQRRLRKPVKSEDLLWW